MKRCAFPPNFNILCSPFTRFSKVIVGAFVISSKNTAAAAAAAVTKEDSSAFPLATTDSSAMIGNNNNHQHQNSDKYPFIIQNATTPLPSPRLSDWRGNNDSRNTSGFNLSGIFSCLSL